jgi:hypothetical protein
VENSSGNRLVSGGNGNFDPKPTYFDASTKGDSDVMVHSHNNANSYPADGAWEISEKDMKVADDLNVTMISVADYPDGTHCASGWDPGTGE